MHMWVEDTDLKVINIALAGVAQWIEHTSLRTKRSSVCFLVRTHASVTDQVGGMLEATNRCFCLTSCFSPSLSPSLPLSLKINKIFTKKGVIGI